MPGKLKRTIIPFIKAVYVPFNFYFLFLSLKYLDFNAYFSHFLERILGFFGELKKYIVTKNFIFHSYLLIRTGWANAEFIRLLLEG